ncbi:MAG: hypothetical protein NDI62_00625 [Burkholderiales bacterium]|nr:hypothetical protein [Burkholderiales bacterium]
MIEIKDLLLKFNNLLFSEEFKKDSIISVINETIGLSLESKDVEIKNNIVYLNIKPIYKNEILIKKDIIFSKLKSILGKKTPNKIV